jgi:hypothetical protein
MATYEAFIVYRDGNPRTFACSASFEAIVDAALAKRAEVGADPFVGVCCPDRCDVDIPCGLTDEEIENLPLGVN